MSLKIYNPNIVCDCSHHEVDHNRKPYRHNGKGCQHEECNCKGYSEPNQNIVRYFDIIKNEGFDWGKFDRILSHAQNGISFNQFLELLKIYSVHASRLTEENALYWKSQWFRLGHEYQYIDRINEEEGN